MLTTEITDKGIAVTVTGAFDKSPIAYILWDHKRHAWAIEITGPYFDRELLPSTKVWASREAAEYAILAYHLEACERGM